MLKHTLTAGVAAILAAGTLSAQRPPSIRDAVGSWIGRAVPVPGKTICPPGSAGCPVPLEIVMVFTVHADGTFIGIDSNIFAGGNHSTAHGQWVFSKSDTIKAAFTFLQEGSNGVFAGGFKNLFEARMTARDRMEGAIEAFYYLYTTPAGAVVTDAEGFPKPNPLDPPAKCNPAEGCTPLGQFSFKVRRVTVPE